MADYTENLSLILPKKSENYNVEVANTNNKIIDVEINKRVEKQAGKGLSSNDFTDKYKTKLDTVSSVYSFKGSKDTYEELPTEENKEGDVWTVINDNKTYAWNGQNWSDIGLKIDLSSVVGKEEFDTTISDLQDYISKATKKDFITVGLSENHKITKVFEDEAISFKKQLEGNGTSLSITENGGILIGENVKSVRVSGNIFLSEAQKTEKKISVNVNSSQKIQNNHIISTASASMSIASKIFNVEEGDIISIALNAISGDVLAALDYKTYISVEVVA